MQTIVLIATYNELENLRMLIPAVLAEIDASLLIVDDNSPDGTPDYLREIAATQPRLIPLNRAQKSGYGTAMLAGFAKANELGADVVITMDADFSHNPKDLPLLQKVIFDNKHDVAIGSRYISGVRVINWAKSRLLLSIFANLYVKTILGIRIEDATSGFRAYSADAIRLIATNPPNSSGYSFLSEILYTVFCANKSICEVPIIYTERREGQSKMSKAVIMEAVMRPWLLRIRHILGK